MPQPLLRKTGNPSGIDGGIETPNINDFNHWGISGTFDWNFDALAVKAIVAHREFDAQWGRDSDASPMPINHTLDTFRDEQDTAELRVSGQLFGERMDWTVGAFYFNADDFNSNISVLFPCILGTSCIDRVDTQTTEYGCVHQYGNEPHGPAVARRRPTPRSASRTTSTTA